ncbi:hypothetical protein F0562_030623 [Nyssa sinensis]|uniref:Uncharacterized protein n=1 Tax=Nyssa sinensis TaxID=561372 RepID=A0A5J5AZA3_9ASTE|nr:hypothetical protein F0562_030623 [Nyssa sinensis]
MGACRRLATEDRFSFAISLVPQPRNPPFYRKDQSGFFYALGAALKEEVLARALHRDSQRTIVFHFSSAITKIYVGQGVSIYTSDMVRELSDPFTRCTLMQFKCHVSLATTDVAEDIEADIAEGGGVVLDEDYLVDQTPSQYRQDPSPPRLFHPDLGASSSNAPLPINR